MAYADESPPTAEDPSRRVDPRARMHVYCQGFLDDACLLYALANAYKSLTGKRVTREHWKQAISQLPAPAAFLGGPGARELQVGEDAHVIGTFSARTATQERSSRSNGSARLRGSWTSAARSRSTVWSFSRTGAGPHGVSEPG
jgi:hypothetical protein